MQEKGEEVTRLNLDDIQFIPKSSETDS